MIIEKRTLNWLPRPSLYQEAEANRLKRKENAQSAMASSSNTASLIGNSTIYSGEAVNLTLRVAAARIQSGVNVKPKG
jgi:hypothetical protein